MLALIFQFVYPFGTIVGVVCMKKYGLRNTLIIGGLLNTLGSLVRYIASLLHNELGDVGTYLLFMLGQVLASIAQPIYVNLPVNV